MWTRQPFETLLPAAEAGEVDVVCATLGVTPERQRMVAFSIPYFRTELACVTLAAPGAPRTLAELAGRRVGAGAGTTSARALALRAPQATAVLENKAGSLWNLVRWTSLRTIKETFTPPTDWRYPHMGAP